MSKQKHKIVHNIEKTNTQSNERRKDGNVEANGRT